jgi:hypothetical protein
MSSEGVAFCKGVRREGGLEEGRERVAGWGRGWWWWMNNGGLMELVERQYDLWLYGSLV